MLGFLLQFSFVIFTVFSNMSTNQQRFSEDAPQPSDFVKVPFVDPMSCDAVARRLHSMRAVPHQHSETTALELSDRITGRVCVHHDHLNLLVNLLRRC